MSDKQGINVRLRTVPQITEAYEWLFEQQRDAKLDTKRADGLNTTLKGVTKLRVEIPMKLATLWFQSQLKKVTVPEKFLPVME